MILNEANQPTDAVTKQAASFDADQPHLITGCYLAQPFEARGSLYEYRRGQVLVLIAASFVALVMLCTLAPRF
jgi:hypothetical protein